MNEFEQLQQEVENLKRELGQLKAGYSVGLDTQRALESRGFSKMDTTTAPSDITRTIALSGNAENIEVLEYPAGWLSVTINGTTYKLAHFS